MINTIIILCLTPIITIILGEIDIITILGETDVDIIMILGDTIVIFMIMPTWPTLMIRGAMMVVLHTWTPPVAVKTLVLEVPQMGQKERFGGNILEKP